MRLSVIILNYNVRYFLQQCILSVKRAVNSMHAEIIVIDNNSEDDSCKMVKNNFPEVILIENKENVGFSKAYNQTVKDAKGEYICILNPDTAVAEDTFIKSLHYADSIKNLGALSIYLMDGTGAFLPESKRNLPTPKVSLLKLMGIGKNYYANHLADEDNGEIDILVGAFMLLKRSVYNKVEGFDEDYFMYGEDIDFSYKITKAGYKNNYMGSIEILHYKGESTKKDGAYLDRFYGSMRIFYKKHFKTNVFLNASVIAGVFIAKIIRRISENKKENYSVNTKLTYLLTENLTLLKKLSNKLDKEIKTTSKTIFSDKTLTNCQFIFDVDYMSYTQIFKVMKKHSNLGNTYYIRPSGCNFILGSDRSDQKGNVIVF